MRLKRLVEFVQPRAAPGTRPKRRGRPCTLLSAQCVLPRSAAVDGHLRALSCKTTRTATPLHRSTHAIRCYSARCAVRELDGDVLRLRHETTGAARRGRRSGVLARRLQLAHHSGDQLLAQRTHVRDGIVHEPAGIALLVRLRRRSLGRAHVVRRAAARIAQNAKPASSAQPAGSGADATATHSAASGRTRVHALVQAASTGAPASACRRDSPDHSARLPSGVSSRCAAVCACSQRHGGAGGRCGGERHPAFTVRAAVLA